MKHSETAPSIPDIWPGGKELQFVNADKFDHNNLLEKLGWGSIKTDALSDANSIKVRQDSLKLCMRSKFLGDYFEDLKVDYKSYKGKAFFEEYGESSFFQQTTKEMIEALIKAKSSPQFDPITAVHEELCTVLPEQQKQSIEKEKEFVAIMESELSKSYSFNGVVKFTTSLNNDIKKIKQESYGFKNYSFHQQKTWIVSLAKKIDSGFNYSSKNKLKMIFMWITRIVLFIPFLISNVILSFAERHKADVLYTTDIPKSVENELYRINNDLIHKIYSNFTERLRLMKIGYVNYDDTDKKLLSSVLIHTEYQFSLTPENGFVVRLIDVDSDISVAEDYAKKIDQNLGNTFDFFSSFYESGQSFYTLIKRALFKRRAKQLRNDAALKYIKLPLRFAVENALIQSRTLLSKGEGIVSSDSYLSMLAEAKYSSVDTAIKALNLQEMFDSINQFRSAMNTLTAVLQSVVTTAETIERTRNKFSDIPFCFPTIVDDNKNIVSFDKLYPLHLLNTPNKDRSKKLVMDDLRPIAGLPPLNGQILSITGQNGGGKTVVEIATIHALTLAHMGFPVFADHFTTNVKDIIAMVFVEKGQGSMLQLLMEKLKIVAETVTKNPNNKVVVIIDELLTGTQEDDGYKIGREYLKMLSRVGCSVLFVTQITQLAEYAASELNALSFHFEKDGIMKPGIGKGNAMHLAEEVGLAKFLI